MLKFSENVLINKLNSNKIDPAYHFISQAQMIEPIC